jgi:hypothetical protein
MKEGLSPPLTKEGWEDLKNRAEAFPRDFLCVFIYFNEKINKNYAELKCEASHNISETL